MFLFIYLFWLHWVLVEVSMIFIVTCGLLSLSIPEGSSFLTRDQTRAPCTGSMESYPVDHQDSEETKIERDTYIPMFTAELFTIVRTWKQPRCPLTDEWIKKLWYIYTMKYSFQFSSVAQSCPTLCDPMNHSTPGLPVHHQLPDFAQTHVHRVSDAIQPSHPVSSPSPPALNLSHVCVLIYGKD